MAQGFAVLPKFLMDSESLSGSWPVLKSASLPGGDSQCCRLLCHVHECDHCLGSWGRGQLWSVTLSGPACARLMELLVAVSESLTYLV